MKFNSTPVSVSSTTSARRGFTLLELLVVIGIIGILIATSLSLFSGATDNAKATKCQTNMVRLAKAALSAAQKDTVNGVIPHAGSYKYADFSSGKLRYPECRGWISWSKAPGAESKGGGNLIGFSEGSDEVRRYAITNGAIWKAIDGSLDSYQCPVHAEACYKKNKRNPGWSYVMNQAFGYDEKNGGGPLPGWKGKSLEGLQNGEKTLLFAEIQGLNSTEYGLTARTEGNGTYGDGVLQYNNEVIGFNHKRNRGLVGHVVFADAHCESLRYPKGGLSLQKLTEALCKGHDLKFDGKKYEDLTPTR